MTDLINARVAEEGEGEHATVASLMENYNHLQNCDVATDMIVAEDDRAGSSATPGRSGPTSARDTAATTSGSRRRLRLTGSAVTSSSGA